MRPCGHEGSTVVIPCVVCESWAAQPELYCRLEELPEIELPKQLAAIRAKGKYVKWLDPDLIQTIAEEFGSTKPIIPAGYEITPNALWVPTVGGSIPDPIIPHPIFGPGTELHTLLKEIGINEFKGCSCRARMGQMNAWGIIGCREHRDEIIQWLKDQRKKTQWGTLFSAACQALWQGKLAINPLSPEEWLVDEAIRRAEAKEVQ